MPSVKARKDWKKRNATIMASCVWCGSLRLLCEYELEKGPRDIYCSRQCVREKKRLGSRLRQMQKAFRRNVLPLASGNSRNGSWAGWIASEVSREYQQRQDKWSTPEAAWTRRLSGMVAGNRVLHGTGRTKGHHSWGERLKALTVRRKPKDAWTSKLHRITGGQHRRIETKQRRQSQHQP